MLQSTGGSMGSLIGNNGCSLVKAPWYRDEPLKPWRNDIRFYAAVRVPGCQRPCLALERLLV